MCVCVYDRPTCHIYKRIEVTLRVSVTSAGIFMASLCGSMQNNFFLVYSAGK